MSSGTSIVVGSQAASLNSLTNSYAIFAAPSGSGYVTVNTSYGQATSTTPLTVVPSAITAANVGSVAVLPSTGDTQSVSIGQQNKYALFEFNATQGQFLSIQVSSLTTAPSGSSVAYQVYSPTNTVVASGSISPSSKSIHLPQIAVAGTYLVTFNSGSNTSVQVSASLETNAALDPSGSSQAVATTVTSQGKRLTFTATAGANLGFAITSLALTPSSVTSATVYIYKPDGSTWTSTSCSLSNGGCDFNLSNAPATGTYTVVVQPNGQATLSFIANLSFDLVTSLTAGTPTTANLSRYGQNGRFTFLGTAGAAAGVQINVNSMTPSGRLLYVTVLKPDGTTLVSGNNYGGYALQIPNLPTTGTYTVFVDPQFGSTANLTAQLSSADGGGVIVDGASKSVSGTTYSYFGFSGTAGDNLGIGISSLVGQNAVNTFAYVYVYKPDGSVLVNNFTCMYANNGCDINLSNLPATGWYGVVVTARSPASEQSLLLSYTATISHDLVTSLTAGTPATANLSRYGQNGRFTFSGTAASSVTLQITNINTTPSGKAVYLTVYKPDGSSLSSGSSTSSYTFTLNNLPATGTYTLFADPQIGSLATMQVTQQ